MSCASASQVGEYILMMLLAFSHRLPDLIEYQRRGVWPKDRWERFSPLELRSSTVGIVGYGSIGRQVARLLYLLGAKVLANKLDGRHREDTGYTIDGLGDVSGDYIHRLYPSEALRSKLLSFAVSSFYTGVGGALMSQYLSHLEPQTFNVGEAITLLVAVIVGGVASVEGSVFGAAFVVLIPAIFSEARWAVPVLFGLSLLGVLIFEPLGLAGAWLKLRLYFRMWPLR